MLLAQLICERPDELGADLMEYYGICIDEAMDGGYSAPFVASLVWQMPQDCRWRVSYDKDAWWTGDRQLAAMLANALRGLVWGLSDKSRRGPEPQPVGPSWATGQRRNGVAMTASALMGELSKQRRPKRNG